jgi:hypothetical protein
MKNHSVQLNIPLDVIKLIVAQLPSYQKQEVVEILVEEKQTKPQKTLLKRLLKGLVADENDFTLAKRELFKHS